jgi:hypothetical protein
VRDGLEGFVVARADGLHSIAGTFRFDGYVDAALIVALHNSRQAVGRVIRAALDVRNDFSCPHCEAYGSEDCQDHFCFLQREQSAALDALPVEASDAQPYRDWCPLRRGDIRCSLDVHHEEPCNFEPLPAPGQPEEEGPCR